MSYRNNCLTPKFLIKEVIKKYPQLPKKTFKNYSDYILYRRWINNGTSTIHQVVEWLKRNRLKINGPIYCWNKIENIRIKKNYQTTFTLSVKGTHRFDSEGVISKNTAADLMKLAMIEIYQDLPKISPQTKMLLQVHDELVFEVPEKEVTEVAKFVEEAMEKVYKLRAPVETHVEVGDNWGNLKRIA